jgi:hypothetical protein
VHSKNLQIGNGGELPYILTGRLLESEFTTQEKMPNGWKANKKIQTKRRFKDVLKTNYYGN